MAKYETMMVTTTNLDEEASNALINKFKNWETSVDLYTTEDYAKLAAIYEANAAK